MRKNVPMRQFAVILISIFLTLGGLAAQETPELLLLRGHKGSSSILATATSADLRYAYTIGGDGAAKVWDVDSGQVIRTLYDPKAYPDEGELGTNRSGAFSPQLDWLLTLDAKGVVRRYSLPDGRLLESFTAAVLADDGWGHARVLKTDGQSIYAVTPERIMKMSLRGKVLAETETPKSATDHHLVSLSADGKYLCVGRGSEVVLYETAGLSESGRREVGGDFLGVAISPDSRHLAVAADSLAILLSMEGLEEKGKVAVGQFDSRVPFWNNGQLLIYPSRSRGEQTLCRVDFASGKLEPLSRDALATSVFVASDSKMVFGGYGGKSWILDFSSGERQKLARDHGGFTAFDIHPTNRDLFTGSPGGEVVRWDPGTGRIGQVYQGLKAYVSSVKVSPDGSKLLGADYSYGLVACWDVASGERLSLVDLRSHGYANGVWRVAWVDSESYIYSASGEPLTLVSARDGQEIHSWKVEGLKPTLSPTAIASKNGRLLAGYPKNYILEVDGKSKRDVLVKKLPGVDRIDAVTYGADTDNVYCLTKMGLLYHWDVGDPENEPQLMARLTPNFLHLEYVDGNLRVWMTNGQLLTLDRNGRTVSTLQLAADGIFGAPLEIEGVIATLDDYFKLRFLDARTGARRGTLVGVRNNRGWVALQESGCFDGNDVGLQTIRFSLGGEVYGVDQFLSQYLRPGILADLLPGSKPLLRSLEPLNSATVKRPPSVKITDPKSGSTVSGESVSVSVKVAERGAGASEPSFYHNGHKLPRSGLKKLDESTYSYSLELVRGVNEIQVSAFDASGKVESRRDRVRVSAPNVPERAPKLHLLSVGIDSYGDDLKLEFAGEDAQAISELFVSELYSPGTRRLLKNGQATHQGIAQALADIAGSARPEDAFVLYLAGHGTVVDDTYYFLPQDVDTDNDSALQKSALSSEMLAQMLASVPATKQLLVLDTCRAGKFLDSAGSLNARRGLEQVRSQNLLSRASGTFLVAATKDQDYAFEIPELGHGILTFSVLDVMSGKRNEATGPITANELLRSVSNAVPKLSYKYHGKRQMVVQYSSGQDFPLSR